MRITRRTCSSYLRLALVVLLSSVSFPYVRLDAAGALRLTLQERVETAAERGGYRVVTKAETWDPSKTVIILCDMWDLHHSKNAVLRAREMAPRMNQILERARSQGGSSSSMRRQAA